ncbi:MAG: hypothetical protein PUD59_01535 [bacterium]|nr:hypothetical protein [bacterium]
MIGWKLSELMTTAATVDSEPKKVKFARPSFQGLKTAVSNRIKNRLNQKYQNAYDNLSKASNIDNDKVSDIKEIVKYTEELSKIGCKLIKIDLKDRRTVTSKSKPIKLKQSFLSNIKDKYKNLKEDNNSINNTVKNSYMESMKNIVYNLNKEDEVSKLSNYKNFEPSLDSEVKNISEDNNKYEENNANSTTTKSDEEEKNNSIFSPPEFNRDLEEGKIVVRIMDLEKEKRDLLASQTESKKYLEDIDTEINNLKIQRENIRNGVVNESVEQKNYRTIKELLDEGYDYKEIIDSALNDEEKFEFWRLINKIDEQKEMQGNGRRV